MKQKESFSVTKQRVDYLLFSDIGLTDDRGNTIIKYENGKKGYGRAKYKGVEIYCPDTYESHFIHVIPGATRKYIAPRFAKYNIPAGQIKVTSIKAKTASGIPEANAEPIEKDEISTHDSADKFVLYDLGAIIGDRPVKTGWLLWKEYWHADFAANHVICFLSHLDEWIDKAADVLEQKWLELESVPAPTPQKNRRQRT